jgi:hypothetical protein
VSAWAIPLDPLISMENLWSLKASDFMNLGSGLGYQWTSGSKDSARVALSDREIFGRPVVESVVRFDGDTVKQVSLTLYARGDSGELTEERFDVLVRDAVAAISKASGVSFINRGKDPTNLVRAERLIWVNSQSQYLLEFSKTKAEKARGIAFRAEFIRLTVTAPEKKLGLLEGASQPQPKKFFGQSHLRKNGESGDVWIGDIPMVDQGAKGYCVVATAERVMRYYGKAVDANELAQLANSSPSRGTNPVALYGALKNLVSRLRLRLRDTHVEETPAEALKLIAEYNRIAKKNKVREIPPLGPVIDIAGIYGSMDVSILKAVRGKNRSDFERFRRRIEAEINQGVPLLWTVVLGLIPEPNIPQNAGGHMRLIIGYNAASEEVLFSDSWGAGHELKRMSMADAWAITMGTKCIEPI